MNIWRAPGPNVPKPDVPRRFIGSTRFEVEPHFSPDGASVAFQSNRTGVSHVWRCDLDGGNLFQVTKDALDASSIRWSPDGRRIAFTGFVEGNGDVYVIDSAGGPLRRLTQEPSNDVARGWSRDGKWIYFGSNRSGELAGWKVPSEGGSAIPVTPNGWLPGEESPDGRYLFVQKSDSSGIWRMPVEGGEAVPILDTPVFNWSWTLWKNNIVYLNETTEEPTIEILNLSTGAVRELARPVPGTTFTFGVTVSPDGNDVLYGQRDQSGSDLVLVENFTEDLGT